MMAFPVGITTLPVIPVPCIPIVADLFIGISAKLPGEGTVAGHYPGSAIVGGFIPDVIMVAKVTITHKKNVLRDADSHMEPQLGWLDKEGRLLVDDSRFMVDRRRRRRDRHHDRRPGAEIDADVKINVGGKGVMCRECGGKRQAKQNPFHMTVPSLV
jgi:hypothetical protein